MKTDRKILEERLRLVINELRLDRKITEELKNKLLKNKILPGTVQAILDNRNSLEELDMVVLCLFTVATYEVTDNVLIKPEDYFTNKEMTNAKSYEIHVEEKLTLPYTFENVLMANSEDYMVAMTIQEIIKLYNGGILEYNFETQRNPRIIEREGTIIKKPRTNKNSVKDIKEKILIGNQFTDTITFNILADGNDTIHYYANKRRLIIESGSIDILDGFHRIDGMAQAIIQNPEIEYVEWVNIKNYSLRKAQQFVAQVNTVNKIDKAHLQALKAEMPSDLTVKELQINSDLKGRIIQASQPTVINRGLVSFSVLSDSIAEVFQPKNNFEARGDLAEYLGRFFDYLLGSFPEEFITNIEEIRKTSLINANMMFAGYVALAKKFKNNNIPLSKLTDIIKSIDFSRTNPMWEEIGVLENGRIAKRSRKKIKDFFEEKEVR